MHAPRARRMMTQTQFKIFTPCALWSNWPLRKITTAFRANIVQLIFRAVTTISALISTDERICAVRRQITVTKFAIRSEFKHHLSHPDCRLIFTPPNQHSTPNASKTEPVSRSRQQSGTSQNKTPSEAIAGALAPAHASETKPPPRR